MLETNYASSWFRIARIWIGFWEQASKYPSQVRAPFMHRASAILLGQRAVALADEEYSKLKEKNWSTACQTTAGCFLTVKNAVEVAIIFKLVTIYEVAFSIRSGGHNPNPGFGDIDSTGVLIDMGGIDEVDLDNNKSLVKVGSGATWNHVYKTLEKDKLTVVGGRVGGVGVGGLILGGGMSHFSNHWGLAADNVQNFEVVLSSSVIVQANAHSNVDLFKALKGGGPNFGIVTRFDLVTYPDYMVRYSIKVFGASERKRVIAAAIRVQKAMETDDKIGFFLTVAKDTLTTGLLYRAWDDFPEVFSDFEDIPVLVNVITPVNGTQLTVCDACTMRAIAKYEIGTVTVQPSAQAYIQHHDALIELLEEKNFTLVFTYQPIGPRAVEEGNIRGGNVLNIPHEAQTWLGIMASSTEEVEKGFMRQKVDRLIQSISSVSKSQGQLLDFQFMNDSSYHQSPLRTYGKESLAFLNSTSDKYDPGKVFQTLQRGGFLLSKA